MFVFSIDKEKSLQLRALTITLDKTLSEQSLLNMASTQELLLIKSLLDEEKAMLQKENKKQPLTAPFHHFRLSSKNTRKLLQMMASLGKVSFQGKQLACDFFAPLQIAFTCDVKEDEKIEVTSLVETGTLKWPLALCDFVFLQNPPFVIKGTLLRFIDDNAYDSTFLKQVAPCREFTKKEYENWLKNIQATVDDASLLKITFTSVPQATIAPVEPLPLLFLADHTAAFASLMMDYEGTIKPFTAEKQELVFEKDLLESGFQKKQIAHSNYYCPVDKAMGAIDFLLDVGWKVLDFKKRELQRLSQVDYVFNEAKEVIQIEGKAHFGAEEVEIATLFDALKNKNNYLDLSNNKAGLLFKKDERLGPLAELARDIEIVSSKAQIKKRCLGLLDEEVQKKLFLQNTKTAIFSASSSFKGELRGYQQYGVQWLQFLYQNGFSGILADDMGLGKTVQVLAFLSSLEQDMQSKKPSLIVVPTSLIFNWQREIAHFFPKATVLVHHGKERSLEKTNATIILTSYGLLREEVHLLEKIHFSCVFLDEAQNIKNSSTKTFQAACRLQSDFRLSITGTPIENSVSELFSQFQFLMPDLLDPEDFSSVAESFVRVKKKIRPFILRRKKEDVAKDLPEKIEQTVFVEMSNAQKTIYERTLASFQAGLLQKIALDGSGKHAMEILEAILRLRQIACHPQLTPQLILDDDTVHSSKFEQTLDDLQTLYLEGKKVVVFSQFSKMLTLFAQEAKERHWNYQLLDGQSQNREKIVDQFQNDPDLLLFFVSLKAGGVGLNLTRADYVILYDPWWNEAAERQATDRAHRIGRKEAVFVKRYVTAQTIEEKVVELQERKRQIAHSILEEGERGESEISNLSIEDLQSLFS